MQDLTYDDWDGVIARYEARREGLRFADGEQFPSADTDLAALFRRPHLAEPKIGGSSYAKKRQQLSPDFVGQPDALFLHALLISALRKRDWPEAAPLLFRRLWFEHGEELRAQLSTRWLISAAITFADHGETEGQRRLGQSLKVLFSLLKLTEFERLYSGNAPDKPFNFGKKSQSPLPMGLEPFALRHGGLDINLLAPIVQEARETPQLGPIALELMDRLNADQGTIFRRLKKMRQKLEARDLTPAP